MSATIATPNSPAGAGSSPSPLFDVCVVCGKTLKDGKAIMWKPRSCGPSMSTMPSAGRGPYCSLECCGVKHPSNDERTCAACSAFQWPYSPYVNVGDVVADAGCMNARRWRDMKDLPQPSCPHRTVVAVYSWGLRVTNGTEESDVVDWFLPNAPAMASPP